MPALVPVAITAPCPAEARDLGAAVRCGYVTVQLDRDAAGPAGRTIRIYFERYLRRDRSRPAESTVVSIEGGPGYSTTADRYGRVELWRPVSLRRNLLLVDLRGTGRSGALRCKAFARSTSDYVARAGRCAAQLGPSRDLYATGRAVEDIESVLRALGATTIDLYGDSYGTYAAQAFALRHPERLRTLALDGAYPLPGTDPTFADLASAVRRGLRLACARRDGCPARRLGVDPVDLVRSFAARLRSRPITGIAPDGDGTPTRVRLDELAFAQVVGSTYYHYAVWRDLLAAIVSARRGDDAPILRLAAETVVVDAGGDDPPTFSEAAYLAVICHDYPQPWDPSTPLDGRAAEAARLIAAYPPGAFWPLSPAAWTGVQYEGVLACLRWPSPADSDTPEPLGAVYPRVPTLVLNGDLDTITTSAQAREVARRFPRSRFVEVRNSVHVTALYDLDDCASRIYWRFVRTRSAGDTSCARRIPEQHVAPSFPLRIGDVRPAWRRAGDGSLVRDRRLAAAAAATVADVVSRWWANYDGSGRGLRGGTWTYEGDAPVAFELRDVELVPGVRVTGSAGWFYGGATSARVTVAGGGSNGTLTIEWPSRPAARAQLRGDVDGRRVRATMLAP
jgi:pimeloyl-ACP methyl ester carboxylesterase